MPFLVFRVVKLVGTRDVVGLGFHVALRDGSDVVVSRLLVIVMEAMRCSLAFLDAFVSLANRGVESGVLGAVVDVGG